MTTEFSKTLKSIRIELKKTQADLCAILDIPLGTYRCWETGRVLPSFENFSKLLSALENTGKFTYETTELERNYNKTKTERS